MNQPRRWGNVNGNAGSNEATPAGKREGRHGSQEVIIGEKFGLLQGTRIISSGVFIAGPFAAEIAAEWGAEVIHVERAGESGDPYRLAGIKLPNRDPSKPPVTTNWIQERRNMLAITLDPSKPAGRDLFVRLLGEADAWIESSKPGTTRVGDWTTPRF